jgi:alkylation response protein AidB-like acyl-CoA dehydrogenase
MTGPEITAMLIGDLQDLPSGHPDTETTEAILRQAVQFADSILVPAGAASDRQGCRVVAGCVKLPAPQHGSWAAFLANGWNALATPEAFGGQALPLTIATAAQMRFDGADLAFSMLPLNQRCAVRLLLKLAPPEVQALWIPRLSAGEWGATICISEPDAGSDVGRIRTRAVPEGQDKVRITGQKCWISYGDHDLTPGIVHFILARSPGLPSGTRGLSLFLLPDRLEDGSRNGASVMRIEEKLGLHASPTCALAFEGALATPLGPPGRGLASLFEMIVAMRLGVAAQGCGIATRACEIAAQYAFARGQGGAPDAPPVPIHTHAEVRRALLEMRLTAESLTALTLQTAAWIDAGDQGDAAAAARAAVLLPVVKALAAEAAFANASQAIQILGGAGYTREWPAERLLRDSRVLSIYEGTTAIQALDLTFRQILGPGSAAARDVLDRLAPAAFLRARLEAMIARVAQAGRAAQEQAALPLLRLFGLACVDGVLRRHATGALATHFSALLDLHETGLEARAAWLSAQGEQAFGDASFGVLFA